MLKVCVHSLICVVKLAIQHAGRQKYCIARNLINLMYFCLSNILPRVDSNINIIVTSGKPQFVVSYSLALHF